MEELIKMTHSLYIILHSYNLDLSMIWQNAGKIDNLSYGLMSANLSHSNIR
jgi:hypothetical protein